MSTLSLQLDSEALQQATIQAITGVLTPEVREKIIVEAVTNGLKSADRYSNKTRIQEIFESAIYDIARKEALRMVAEDEGFAEAFKSLMSSAMTKAITADSEELSRKLADTFLEVISIRD